MGREIATLFFPLYGMIEDIYFIFFISMKEKGWRECERYTYWLPMLHLVEESTGGDSGDLPAQHLSWLSLSGQEVK